ncbi:MAG: hypothetical protein K0S55_486 [Clostridia bacterium]|jgi:uncharacterized membrane protein YbaN (DUF454 family)|nr:hypothetical protein [Clostridia bacterium]
MVLGIIGITIPILPTAPFLLLSAACYIKSSDKLYNFLINNKFFGKYLRSYLNNDGISIKLKIITIILLWTSILFSIIFIISLFWIKIILFIIAISVTIHLYMLKTLKRKNIVNIAEKHSPTEKL